MKIEGTIPIAGDLVTTDEDEYNEYIRYGADRWYVLMGESIESEYECKELERLYQEFNGGVNAKEK